MHGGTDRATGGFPLGAVPALGRSGCGGTGVLGLCGLPGAGFVLLEVLQEGWGIGELQKVVLMHPCTGPLTASGGKRRSWGSTAALSVAFKSREKVLGHKDSLKTSSLTLAKSTDFNLASSGLCN